MSKILTEKEEIIYDEELGNWYSLQVYMGSEMAVKRNIEDKLKMLNMENEISNILVPIKKVISISPKGKETLLTKAIYQGYAFIQIKDLTKNLWKIISDISKVSCFIGGKDPIVLSKEDILKVIEKYNKPVETGYRVSFEEGDMVLVKEGEFANFKGTVKTFNPDKNDIDIEINIFGRPTLVKDINIKIVEKVLD